MGGYGAWYLALSNPDLYCKAASMSGALDIAKVYENIKNGIIQGPFEWNNIFENPEHLQGSKADLFKLYDDCMSLGTIPELYQSCGTDDFLYKLNLSVKAMLEQKKASFTYEEDKGGHDWDFWDKHIQSVLSWMFSPNYIAAKTY
jgi:S-formylglutathione hydrolase FrmB